MLHIDYVLSVCVYNRMIAPTIVNIFYHNVTVTVKYCYNIPLRVLTVKILFIRIYHARNAAIVIDKL